MVDTIKFSEMPNAGNINNNDIMPSLRSGANVILNNPWTFLPPGTTAQRPTPSSTVNYRLRFNTDEQLYEYYDAVLGAWTQLQESAFTQGPFITYTASASLPDAQNLGILADGILIQTITAGVATIDILPIPLRGAKGGTGIDNGILTIALTSGSTGYVMTSDSSGNATWAAPGYLTDAVLLNPSADQTITAHNLSLATGSMFATLGSYTSGSAAGGFQGKFTAFSTTAALGSTALQAANNAGNFANVLTNASTSAARTWTLPDATGTIALTGSSVQTINGDSGSATPSGGVITFTGGSTGLTFTGAGSTVTLGGGSALTKTDDTNVTLTLGGSASTSLVHAASLTLGWTGQLSETRGGTAQSTYTLGDTLYASAANTLSKLSGNTTAVKQYLSQTGTGAVSAAPVWATISGGDITGAALTKTDDTNVTLTLGGTPSTALLRAASLTLGWTGQLGLTRGGSNASLTASNGGIVYSTASAMAILAGTATANLPLLSGSSAAPAWGAFALNLGGALTTAGALTTVGAFGVTFTFTNTTGVTFPTSGTLATTSQIPTGAALTKTDDTNVTLTLGGSPTTALVNAASLTLGWTGQLGLTRGGTAASLTASNGGLVYSTASALAILAGTATAGQIPRSGASGAPSWSTATYPATAGTQYNALASDGTNFTSQTLTSLLDGAFGSAQGDILYRNASAWVVLAPGTSGQFLKTLGAGANPVWASGTVNGFTQIVVQVFTSSGTYTPTASMKYALIEGVGAGGGSGGATSNAASTYAGSGGGGGGGYSSTVASAATVGASQTVTIGAAGTGGANGTTAGGNGGDTSVGSIMIAKGGSGSQKSQDGGSGGLGGVVGTGDFSSTGNSGTNGQYQIPTVSTPAIVGTGGGSFWGGGGLPTVVGQGNAGTAYGGGGGGSGSFNQVGNAGAAGFKGAVRITEFI